MKGLRNIDALFISTEHHVGSLCDPTGQRWLGGPQTADRPEAPRSTAKHVLGVSVPRWYVAVKHAGAVDPLVIIPTYNERDNLPLIVSRLLAIDGLRVLVVDDASPDGTGEVADRAAADAGGRMTVLHRTGARGLGLSYVEAMHRALNLGATHICQMDCDLSHDPGDVPRLLAATSEADMVIGSRYVAGGRIENWPMRRVVLSAFANRYVRTITGLQINDCTSGFRCWRREALARLPIDRIRSDGYAFLVEMAWEAAAAGCRVTELPITFVERRQGASKLSWRVVLESAILPWRLGLRARI